MAQLQAYVVIVSSSARHFRQYIRCVQENKGGVWSDKVYWQVADGRRRPSGKIDSSRSTQLGKEDFYVVVIVPTLDLRG